MIKNKLQNIIISSKYKNFNMSFIALKVEKRSQLLNLIYKDYSTKPEQSLLHSYSFNYLNKLNRFVNCIEKLQKDKILQTKWGDSLIFFSGFPLNFRVNEKDINGI